jgi:YD repeat-containing protein
MTNPKLTVILALVLLTLIPLISAQISLTYDELDRIKTKSTNEESINYFYDDNKQGTLSSVQTPFITKNYKYDDKLRSIEEEKVIDGISFKTKYSYDSMDRVVSKTLPNGDIINYDYNNQGALDKISGIISNIDYNAIGQAIKTVFSNNLVTQKQYDSNNHRLLQIKTGDKQDLSYSYDNAGNLKAINDNVNQITESMGYDDLYRLSSSQQIDNAQQGNVILSLSYTYDSIGNIMKISLSPYTLEYSYSQRPVHAPSKIEQTVKGVENKYYVKDVLGDNLAWFGDAGNMFIKGTLEQSSNFQRTGNSVLVIRNNGEDVLIIENNGSMYIDGAINENQATLNSLNENNDFRIKNSNGNLVAFVSESGNVFLKGNLTSSTPNEQPYSNKYYIKDNSGNNIVSFSDGGDIVIKGAIQQNSNFQITDNSVFIIRNNGEDVLIIENDGSMYIDGAINENQATLTSLNENNDFRIKDSDGNLAAYISEPGDIFLTGALTENGNP